MNAEQKRYTDDEYEDILNDIYADDVSVCGYPMQQGSILREVDPIAFSCSKNDYEAGPDNPWVCKECETEYDNEEEAEACCKREYLSRLLE